MEMFIGSFLYVMGYYIVSRYSRDGLIKIWIIKSFYVIYIFFGYDFWKDGINE